MRLLLAALVCPVLHAADWPEPPVLILPRLAAPPAMDARGSDAVWQQAAIISELAPARVDAGRPPSPASRPTEVRLGWTPDALHLRAVCSADDGWNQATARDDEVFRGDCIEWFIDPVGDGLAVAEFQFSPAGVIFDQQLLLTATPHFQTDGRLEWDLLRNLWSVPTWNADDVRIVTRRTSDGWEVEVAIPAKPLLTRSGGQALAPGMVMRANLLRLDWRPAAEGKRDMVSGSWSPAMYGCPHFSHGRLGYLHLGG